MRRLLAYRPSPAMVVACIALIVALGGTGYAAITLPRNSVGAAQLRSGAVTSAKLRGSAVTSAKVRDGSLRARDFAADELMRGPRGAQGPPGETALGQLSRSAFASRQTGQAPVPLTPIGSFVDVLDLAVPAGSSGYTASSGNLEVSAAVRLVAVANVTLHSDPATSTVVCRLLRGDDDAFGSHSNGNLIAASHLSLSVTGGIDLPAGVHRVRVQCQGHAAGFTFHRGNLTVVATPR